MRLDVEPLRASFDALPEDCQEPMLRLSASIERLSRVALVSSYCARRRSSPGRASPRAVFHTVSCMRVFIGTGPCHGDAGRSASGTAAQHDPDHVDGDPNRLRR